MPTKIIHKSNKITNLNYLFKPVDKPLPANLVLLASWLLIFGLALAAGYYQTKYEQLTRQYRQLQTKYDKVRQ